MTHYEPGAIGFSHSKGIIGWAIRLGEFLRFRDGQFWNHAFIVSDKVDANGEQLVIQALGSGVNAKKRLSEIAPGGKFEILPLPAEVLADDVLLFAEAQVGDKYGWLSIFSVTLQILLPKWIPLPHIRTGSSWICSALASESLRCGGWIHKWDDIYSVVPSELYAAMIGISVKDLPYRDFAKTL